MQVFFRIVENGQTRDEMVEATSVQAATRQLLGVEDGQPTPAAARFTLARTVTYLDDVRHIYGATSLAALNRVAPSIAPPSE